MTANEWTAAGTWATLLVLTLTLVLLRRQVKEAVELRRQQSRPYVVVSLDVEQRSLLMLVVENVGPTPAYDVRLEFDEPPRSSLHDLANIPMLRQPIPMIPPGRKLRANWDLGFKVLAEDYPHPVCYRPTVRYRDQQGREYGPEEYILDFRQYDGLARGLAGVPELVKAVEEVGQVLKKRGP